MFKLLIIGATGLVGGKIVTMALLNPRITHVVVVSRRPLAAHPKLENYVIDFDALPLDAPWWNVDAALCAMGTTKQETQSKTLYHKIDVEYPLAIAALVKKHGAKSFGIVSSSGASLNSPFSYLAMKGETEALLAKIGFSSLTIIRPAFITGEREKARSLEKLWSPIWHIFSPLLPKRWHAVSAERIAKAMLESALNPQPGLTIRESETL